jgi:hypothetical protein
MAKPIVEQRDVIILQRDPSNSAWEEIHVSGSNLIFFTDTNGNLTAAKQFASASYALTSSAVETLSPETSSTAPVTLAGYYQQKVGGNSYWIPYYTSP